MFASNRQYDDDSVAGAGHELVEVPKTWDFDPFTNWLGQGESFLWVGRPDKKSMVKFCASQGVAGRYVAHLRVIAAAAASGFVVLETRGTTQISLTIGIIGAVTLGLSVLLSWINSSLARYRALTTYYAVTNQRILICTKEWYSPPIRVSMPVGAASTHLEVLPDKSGAIYFDCPDDLVTTDLDESHAHSLRNVFAYIPEAKRVRNLIQAARTMTTEGIHAHVVDEEDQALAA